jgi:integrase/recombinase XerD
MQRFEEILRCKTGSEATVRNYLGIVRRFLDYAKGKKGRPEEVVRQYLLWHVKAKAPKTHNLHRSAVVCFFKLALGYHITTDMVPRRKVPRRYPKTLPAETIRAAIRKTTNLKHRLELMLFYTCGLRLGEVAHLQHKHIANGRLWLSKTKGGKERIVPIPPSVLPLLLEYTADMAPNQYVFAGQRGGHISNKSLQNVVKQALGRVGAEGHPHLLRHGFAIHELRAGENIRKVQEWLGHASLETTEQYLAVTEAELAESTDLLTEQNYANV